MRGSGGGAGRAARGFAGPEGSTSPYRIPPPITAATSTTRIFVPIGPHYHHATHLSQPMHEKRIEIRWRDQERTSSGELAAEAEAVLVARNRETGASRPLFDAERAALERELQSA